MNWFRCRILPGMQDGGGREVCGVQESQREIPVHRAARPDQHRAPLRCGSDAGADEYILREGESPRDATSHCLPIVI